MAAMYDNDVTHPDQTACTDGLVLLLPLRSSPIAVLRQAATKASRRFLAQATGLANQGR